MEIVHYRKLISITVKTFCGKVYFLLHEISLIYYFGGFLNNRQIWHIWTPNIIKTKDRNYNVMHHLIYKKYKSKIKHLYTELCRAILYTPYKSHIFKYDFSYIKLDCITL